VGITLISPKPGHGVILRPVSTNICGSDQPMAHGRTTAPHGQTLGHEITAAFNLLKFPDRDQAMEKLCLSTSEFQERKSSLGSNGCIPRFGMYSRSGQSLKTGSKCGLRSTIPSPDIGG
jgi:hypothetical protein